jgi:hypothetical protein
LIDMSSDSILQHGFCWSTEENPEIEDDTCQLGSLSNTGRFSSLISGLQSETGYYGKAFAADENGTVYGEQFFFTTESARAPRVNTDSISDKATKFCSFLGDHRGQWGTGDYRARILLGSHLRSDPQSEPSQCRIRDGSFFSNSIKPIAL